MERKERSLSARSEVVPYSLVEAEAVDSQVASYLLALKAEAVRSEVASCSLLETGQCRTCEIILV